MKTNLKRLVSLLLVVVMLASSFSGFGTLTAHAQHFTLIRPDEYPYLHIENDMTLQLDLTGRSGTIGAISWQLTEEDGTPIVGTPETPVFTVGTSPEAAALGASDDLITLHGDIIAAELGVTPTIPKEGINIRLHYEEAGNMSGVDDIWLMGDWWEPNNGFPKPQRTDYLVGYSHRSGADCLSGVFNVNRRDAAHPQGDDLEAYITALYTIENLDAEGNPTEADVITFERISDYEWCFSAQMPGSTVFRATYEDAEGTTGFYDFTLNAVTTLYELQPHFPNGTLCVLKNGTLTVDTIVLRRTAVPQDGGGYMISSEPVESYTLNAVSDDTTLILPTVSGNIVELAASDLPGSARVTFTASGTYGGEAFSVTSEEYWIDLMDHYGQLQFEGFDPNIEVGETIDMSGFFRYFEYTYSPNGNSIVDRTADTIWTIWDDNNVFTMDSAALPVLERVSPDSTMLFVSASLDCGDYGTMNDEVCFGVDPRNNGGSGSEGNLLMYWEDPDTYNIFDTETSHYPLYTEISNMGDAQIDIVVDCGQWDEEGNFISWGSDMITGEDGIYAVNGAALLEAAAEHCGVADEYNFSLRACLYVDGELCNEETTWGNLWRSHVQYLFPGDDIGIKSRGSSTHILESVYSYHLVNADNPGGYYGTVQLNDIQVSNVNGTADVTVTPVGDEWELSIGHSFEGSFDTTLYYTDVMTGEEASYTYTTTRVNELWNVNLIAPERYLLPGETRTVTAEIEHLLYDSEQGCIYGDTTDATLHWETEQFPGVTYTPNDNTLTVATTLETGINNTLGIGVWLEIDAPVLPCEPIYLRTRDCYYTMDHDNMADPAFGESCTYTPVVEYTWLDEEAADPIQRRNLTAADSSYYLTISYWGDLSVSVDGTTVPGTHEEATYPLGTAFTYSRTGIGESELEIALHNYVNPEYSEHILSIGSHFPSIDFAAAFNQEVYTLNVGDTLDLLGELTFEPAGIGEQLVEAYWRHDANDVISIDENGVASALTPGETWVGYIYPYSGILAECTVCVIDPNAPPAGEIEFNEPNYRHIFENQTLVVPLDTTGIHGNDELQLELDCGYWNNGTFISFGSGILTPVKDDPNDATLVTGVSVNGEALHAAADAAIPYGFDSHGFALIARVLNADGTVHCATSTDLEMRKTRADYMFEEDFTILADNNPIHLTFSNTYGMYTYFGYDHYENNERYADGVYEEGRFWSQRCNAEGNMEGVVFQEDTANDCYELIIPAGFIGEIEITQVFTGRFAQGGSTPYTFVVTVAPEIWNLRMTLEGREWNLLPGETRTFVADYEHIVYDPEQGHVLGSTDGVELVWKYDPMPGVTYTPSGNKLTIATTSEAEPSGIMVGASLMDGDTELVGEFDILWMTHDYHTIVTETLGPDMELGESKTFTPELHHYWLDDNRAIHSQKEAAGSGFEWVIQSGDEVFAGLTVNGAAVASGDRFPLDTTFTYTQSVPSYVSFALEAVRVDEEYQPVAGYGYELNAVGAELAAKQDTYVLPAGNTLDLMSVLEYSPENLLDYLGELSWVSDDPVIAAVDNAAGKLSAITPGTTSVYLMSDSYGELVRIDIRVTDPSDNDVFWGAPDYAHIFENQILYYPLDTSTIAGKTNVTLELDCGYWENDTFISFGDGMLTKQYDTETGTVVTGVHISGEKLHEAATSLIPYEFINHELELVARVYVDGALYDEFYAPFELRTTYVDFRFEEDSTILTDLVPMQFAFDMNYELWVQFGHDNYQDGEPYADGVFETATFGDMEATVLEGDKNAVTMEPNDDGSAYLLTVAPGFLGKVKISQYYADPLDPAASPEHSFVLTFTDEMWGTWVEVSENQLLPGEQRTVTAHVEHLVYNPEEGQIPASTSGASVVWEYDSSLAGVTYTPNGNALTIKTTGAAEFVPIPLTASVKVGGTVVATEHIDLSVTESYFAFDLSSQIKNVALGDSATIKPVLTYHWLDAAGKPQSKAMTAADSDYVLEMFLYQDSLPNLTVNGTAVNHGDTFPLGTTFTYKQLTPDPTEFFIDAVLKDEDSSMFLNSSYYYIECADEIELNFAKNGFTMTAGDTLDLKAQLVYSPSNLLNHIGSVSWKSENTAVATVDAATGKVTAKTAGVAEIVLSSDLYDEILRTVVIVAAVDAGIKDPIPEQDVTKPVENVTVVRDPETEATVKNETIGLLGKLVEDEGVDSCFDGDVDKLINAVETGASLKTELISTPMDDAAVSDLPVADQKALNDKITAVLGAGADAAYFDITLQVTANGEQLGTMTQTDEKIKIRLTIPTDLRDPSYKFTVFRLHNGVVEVLDTTNNGDWTVTIFSDRFSTYALGYTAAGVTRLFGENRYETSLKIADATKAAQGMDKFSNIIVASGAGFADALAGSYLAKVKDAPILMAQAAGLNVDMLKTYIAENLAPGGTVYILGGINAVPAALDTALSGYNVKRLAGNDRYETNILILKEAGVTNEEILVCKAQDFADSLSASAVGKPILLVNSNTSKLTDMQKAYLAELSTDKFYIIGGENAVNSTLENAIKTYGSVERIAGENRYETSVKVAQKFFSQPNAAVLAYARNFPDGLCGGPLALAMDAPLILTKTDAQLYAKAYAQEKGIASGYVLGGTGLIDDPTAKDIFGAETIEVN